MAAFLFPELIFEDNTTGSPLAAGTIETYIAGTSTPAVTYTDAGGLTSVGTYVPLDANGRPNNGNGIWLGAGVNYKFIIKDSDGSTVQTVDNVSPGGFSGTSAYITATADPTLTGSRVLSNSTTNTIVDAGAGSTIQVQRTALTGDVTASANSNATTIAANAVTTAKILDANVTLVKMANIATDSLIGRDTAGSGVPENITLNSTLEMTGAGALQRAALTGDVAATAGSNTTTIGTAAVTLAKMANIATDTLIGRDTAASGVPETITMGGGLAFSGSQTIHSTKAINSQTGTTYTALAGDRGKHVIFTTQATATLSLTAAATLGDGWYCHITNQNTGLLSIDPNSTETINGASASLPIPAKSGGLLLCTGAAFYFHLALPVVESSSVPIYNLGDTSAMTIGSIACPTLVYVQSTGTLQVDGSTAVPYTVGSSLSSNTDNLVIGKETHLSLNQIGAGYNLTGMVPTHTSGQILYLSNASAYNMTLKNNVTSTATNRFLFSTGADIVLPAEATIQLIYHNNSGTGGRWRNVV